VSLKRGVTTYDLSAAYARQFNRTTGPQSTRDASGRRTQISDQVQRSRFQETSLRGGVKTRAGETKLGLTLGVEQERARVLRTADILDGQNNLLGSEFLRERSPDRETEYEIGGDIETPVTSRLTSKFIGLYNLDTFSGDGFVENKRTGVADEIFRSLTRNRETETILRLQNDWAVAANHAVQFGGEIALNRLRANFQSSNNQNGAITNLPASNVRVKEWRYEPFVSDVWTISPNWKLEAGLVFERSKLTVSGESSASRTLQFLKPRTVATWTLNSKSSLEFRVERDVSQLDFDDFATNVDLSADGLVDAGNAELVPEKIWTVATTLRQKFWDRGSIQLEASYELITDTQDLVLITQKDTSGAILARFDGAGNIGKARRWNLELELTLPLDRFTHFAGITGMEIKYVGHYHPSRVTDPVTGLSRRISQRPKHHHDVTFRHDLAASGVSWGFDMSYAAPRFRYFFNQIERGGESAPEFFTWIEYRKWKYGTLRFQAGNPTDIGISRDLTIYRDTRATNDIIRTVSRTRSRDTRFLFSLTGKF
jgi:outer membrane receptor protein involved in Fe transport